MNKNILALDLGTTFGVYDGMSPPEVYTLSKDSRILEFYDWLDARLYDGNLESDIPHYDVVVIENANSQKGLAMERFQELHTLVKMLCLQHEVDLEYIYPAHLKKIFAGNGKATKDDIINKCLDMGILLPSRIMKAGPDKGKVRYDSNAADAVAVYHTYIADKLKEESSG